MDDEIKRLIKKLKYHAPLHDNENTLLYNFINELTQKIIQVEKQLDYLKSEKEYFQKFCYDYLEVDNLHTDTDLKEISAYHRVKHLEKDLEQTRGELLYYKYKVKSLEDYIDRK